MDKVVPLSRSYSVASKTFDSITLREPTYSDVYISGLGEPQEWQPVPGGQALLTYPERIDGYLQRLTVEPGYEFLARLAIADTLRLKDAVCAFFTESRTSSPSQTASSSGSDGTPAASVE